jgi:hypothetical protein
MNTNILESLKNYKNKIVFFYKITKTTHLRRTRLNTISITCENQPFIFILLPLPIGECLE